MVRDIKLIRDFEIINLKLFSIKKQKQQSNGYSFSSRQEPVTTLLWMGYFDDMPLALFIKLFI